MSLVLDSSMTLNWCFADERTEASRAVLERVMEDGAVVPQLWPLEVLNGLLMAERRGRVTTENRQQLVRSLKTLPVAVDPETAGRAWERTVELAGRYRLTAYDAAYLETAERKGLPLATLDVDLRRAAVEGGVALVG